MSMEDNTNIAETVDNTNMGGENFSLDSNIDILFDKAMSA